MTVAARTCNLVEHFECDDYVVLLIAAQGATYAIEQKTLRLVDDFLR